MAVKKPAAPGPEGRAGRARAYPFILIDAALYCLLAHQAADAALLAHDGFYSRGVAVAILIGIAAALLLLEREYWRLNKRHGFTPHTPRIAAAAGLLVFFGLFVALPLLKVSAPVEKGMTYLFLPLEWHKFPRNYLLMLRVSPGYMLAGAGFFAAAVYLRFVGRRRLWVALALFALFLLFSIKSLSVVNFDTKKNLSFFFYPFLFACVAGMFGWPRLFARIAAAGVSFALVGVFYTGMMPLKFAFGDGVRETTYLKRVFEPSRVTSDIAPMFFREMKASPDGNFVYISYGPTSGIAKIDVRNGRLDKLLHIPGMMRFLWDGGPDAPLLGLDWLHADMHFFNKKPFMKTRTVDLLATDPTPSPFDFDVDPARGRLFIINYELSGISTYSYPGMKKIARSDFRKQGITRLNSGGQRIVYDARNNKIYALTGWIHWMQDYYILRINPDTLEVEKTLRLPTAGLELSFCEAAGALFSVDFYGRALYEIDAPSMRLKRVLRGPLGSRNVECDIERGNIYTTGYADGMLHVLDYKSGRAKAEFCVGPKPSSMALSSAAGELFIGSGAGILKVDLDRLPDVRK